MSAYGVPARLASVSMQPPISRPLTSTGSPPGSSRAQDPVPLNVWVVTSGWAVQSSQVPARCTPGEDWVNVLPAGSVATSSQLSSGGGTSYGVSIRLLPCTVATPVSGVIGVISVEMSETPTTHVGGAAAIACQSRSGSRSIAVSPPQGGTTAR